MQDETIKKQLWELIEYDADDNIVEYNDADVSSEVEAQQYYYNRQREYPSIVDQLDTLYHGGYDAWKQSIDVIKERYPKTTLRSSKPKISKARKSKGS